MFLATVHCIFSMSVFWSEKTTFADANNWKIASAFNLMQIMQILCASSRMSPILFILLEMFFLYFFCITQFCLSPWIQWNLLCYGEITKTFLVAMSFGKKCFDKILKMHDSDYVQTLKITWIQIMMMFIVNSSYYSSKCNNKLHLICP